MIHRRQLLAAGAASVAAALPLAGRAQPDKPVIRILVGLPPGGGTDAIARFFADKLALELGQPVLIDSKVGAGGRFACDALMAAAPDGLTWMIAPNATPTFQTLVFGPQLKWQLFRDFAPVAALVAYPLGMAVAPSTGASRLMRSGEVTSTRTSQSRMMKATCSGLSSGFSGTNTAPAIGAPKLAITHSKRFSR